MFNSSIELFTIRELISSLFILAGAVFMLISSIGLLRFPDFYIRMSAITKGATLGIGLILTGMGIYFNQSDMLLKVVVIICFTFITAPVAAHVIGRTAVWNKIPFWRKTNLTEVQPYLDKIPDIKHKPDSTDNLHASLPPASGQPEQPL